MVCGAIGPLPWFFDGVGRGYAGKDCGSGWEGHWSWEGTLQGTGSGLRGGTKFQQQKERANTLSNNAEHSAKKLKDANEWMAIMNQRMTHAHQGESKSKAEIANLKESFQAKTKDLKEDACTHVH